MEMRKVFATELEQLMHKNKKICLIDADLAKASGTHNLRNIFQLALLTLVLPNKTWQA